MQANNPYCKPVSPVGAGNSPPVTPGPQGESRRNRTRWSYRFNRSRSCLLVERHHPGAPPQGNPGGNCCYYITPTYPGSCSAGRGGAGGTGVSSSTLQVHQCDKSWFRWSWSDNSYLTGARWCRWFRLVVEMVVFTILFLVIVDRPVMQRSIQVMEVQLITIFQVQQLDQIANFEWYRWR